MRLTLDDVQGQVPRVVYSPSWACIYESEAKSLFVEFPRFFEVFNAYRCVAVGGKPYENCISSVIYMVYPPSNKYFLMSIWVKSYIEPYILDSVLG